MKRVEAAISTTAIAVRSEKVAGRMRKAVAFMRQIPRSNGNRKETAGPSMARPLTLCVQPESVMPDTRATRASLSSEKSRRSEQGN